MFSPKVWSSSVICLIVLLSIFHESMALEGLTSLGAAKAKRRFFDPNCKGIYDRQIFSQLEQVCEDCYNLYRKPAVATECRRDCYNSEVFESCLRDLMLHDMMAEYKSMSQMVAGRK